LDFIFSDKDATTLSTPIKDVNQAKLFLLMLAANGLLFMSLRTGIAGLFLLPHAAALK
jgi:hypothetical protein